MNYFKYVIYLAVTACISSAFADPREDFFRAVGNDADYTVADMLKAGFDPNTINVDGQRGLTLALRNSAAKVAALLLADPRTEIDSPNAAGETPLMLAALRGNLPVVKDLLARGARVNRDGWTPLHYAASSESPDTVTLLLDRGAQIDARSPNGTTPLMMAARYGAIDSADLLLERGADATLRNQRGMTAADFAATASREPLAERLRRR
jgi:ankyrin repeat protein